MVSNAINCNETRIESPEGHLRRRTPLPAGQLAILLYLRFCEAASMSVIFPFLEELLASVIGDEKKVGYYAGVMATMRQALSLVTIMFWSRLSDYIGRKPILLLGTFALAVSTTSFGLSSVFWALVLSQCIFTGFNNNAGVIKSMIGEITDETNTADAFALLHMPWVCGNAFGVLVGGRLASPHLNFPSWFRAQVWTNYPYFLPCFTVACFSSVGCLIIVVYLKETLRGRLARYQLPGRPVYADDPSQPLLSTTPESNEPPPMRSLLTPPILLACANYCVLGSLHLASTTLQPLFYGLPVPIGGLGLSPRSIGDILGIYGLINIFVQTFLLGHLVRRYGSRAVFISASAALLPGFILPPVMNWCLRIYGWDNLWWGSLVKGMLAIQVASGLVLELGYGSIYMFINASAPNKRALGSVNGLGQTLVCIGRMIMIALATSLFSYSIEHETLGGHGYLAYFTLVVITFGGISLAPRLPQIGGGSLRL